MQLSPHLVVDKEQLNHPVDFFNKFWLLQLSDYQQMVA